MSIAKAASILVLAWAQVGTLAARRNSQVHTMLSEASTQFSKCCCELGKCSDENVREHLLGQETWLDIKINDTTSYCCTPRFSIAAPILLRVCDVFGSYQTSISDLSLPEDHDVATCEVATTTTTTTTQAEPLETDNETVSETVWEDPNETDSGCERLVQVEPLEEDETEIIFVRHGLSLNNVFKHHVVRNAWSTIGVKWVGNDNSGIDWNSSGSYFKAGYSRVCREQNLCGDYMGQSSLAWELGRMSRDCLLLPDGEYTTFQLQKLLLKVLPRDYTIDGFYTSPLRRTLQTLLAGFSEFMVTSRSHVGLAPWAHERFKSDSDLANDGDINAAFLLKYRHHMILESHTKGIIPPPLNAVETLRRDLWKLGYDWVDKYGNTHPKHPRIAAVKDKVDGYERYYPRGWMNGYKESWSQLEERMVVLRRWLQTLPSGGRYVLVSHGGVSEALFGKKLHNLGVAVARFKKGAPAENATGFFSRVDLASKLWDCHLFPGWAGE